MRFNYAMKNQKGFVPIIIILIVLIGIGGVYYLGTLKTKQAVEPRTASSESLVDQTRDGKIYKNSKYTFKHPIQWDTFVLCETTENPILMIAPQVNIDEIKKGATCGFGTGKYLTLTIMTRSFENIIKSSDYLSVTITPTKIDDKDATRYDSVAIKDLGPMQKGDKETLVVVKYGERYLEILLLDQKYINEFDQILSNFKFTE